MPVTVGRLSVWTNLWSRLIGLSGWLPGRLGVSLRLGCIGHPARRASLAHCQAHWQAGSDAGGARAQCRAAIAGLAAAGDSA